MEGTPLSQTAKLAKHGLLSAIVLLSGSGFVSAQTFNYAGTLSSPNQLFQIWFTLPSSANVTIKTTSWAAGNFDPVAWLYDANLNQIAKNDDSCNGQGCSPVSRDSLIQVNSLDQAIDWMKRAPFDGGAEIEIRQIFDAEDFGEALTPELREQEARLRAQAAKK